MLQVTDAALTRLTALLDGSEPGEGDCLRLTQKEPGDFGLALDAPREGDAVFALEARDVLAVDEATCAGLDDAIMDVVDGDGGPRLGFLPQDLATEAEASEGGS
ncbi:MAG: hypothetical protein WD058_02410 [Dehalococcoidia bacterium]